jgi:hypothetical protein
LGQPYHIRILTILKELRIVVPRDCEIFSLLVSGVAKETLGQGGCFHMKFFIKIKDGFLVSMNSLLYWLEKRQRDRKMKARLERFEQKQTLNQQAAFSFEKTS